MREGKVASKFNFNTLSNWPGRSLIRQSTSEERVPALVSDVLDRQQASQCAIPHAGEKEYGIKDNAVYILRIVPHSRVNCEFVLDSGSATQARQKQLKHQEPPPALHG